MTALIVPDDVQSLDAVETPPREHGTVHSGIGYSPSATVPDHQNLERAATILNEGEKIAMFVGAGCLNATDEVIEVAETLGAGVAKALLGRAAVPDDLPFVTGQTGLLGTKPSWDLMQDCDTFFMIGSGFPYSEFLPKEGKGHGVQIDIDPRMLSLRYPMEVALQGDAPAIGDLLPRIRDIKTLQKFASAHASVHNRFNLERHLTPRDTFKKNRSAALAEWQQLAA